MPRYYFHVVRANTCIRDAEGTELHGLAEARAEAIQDARTLMSLAILEGVDISGRSIEICDEGGNIVLRLPFTEAVRRGD